MMGDREECRGRYQHLELWDIERGGRRPQAGIGLGADETWLTGGGRKFGVLPPRWVEVLTSPMQGQTAIYA